MTKWVSSLELDSRREVTCGSPEALCAAIRRGADLRIYTEFLHNEHIDPASDSAELIREVAEFRVTYLVEDRWCAGIMTLRQPMACPTGSAPAPRCRSSCTTRMASKPSPGLTWRRHASGSRRDRAPRRWTTGAPTQVSPAGRLGRRDQRAQQQLHL